MASRWSESSGRRRRVYRLTRKGNRALGERADEWRTLTRAVNDILAGPA